MKTILFVLDGGFDGGGAERVASRLIDAWIRSGIHVTVLSISNFKQEFYDLPEQVDRIFLGNIDYSNNLPSRIYGHLSNLVKLRRVIRQCKADVVLSFLTRTNIRTIFASLGLGKRIVISERNDPSRQQYKSVWKVLRCLLYRRSSVITANTRSALEHMKSYVPEKKLAYIHNPILISLDQAKPAESRKILNVGRLVPQKSQGLILEAFATLNKSDWYINFLGDGPDENELLNKARLLGIENNLSMRGFVKDTEKYYLEAGLFVLASEHEGMSNALLEAMSYGLPCVVSDALPGALEHIIHGQTGVVFEAGNARDLAEKLLMLMSQPELRARLGAAARARISQYSIEKIVEDWNKILFPMN